LQGWNVNSFDLVFKDLRVAGITLEFVD